MFSHGVASDRVYIVKPMSPWAGWALTPPFHPCRNGETAPAVYLCCTCPGVTPGGRYPLSLPCEARTFLKQRLSASARGCPTWSRKYCTAREGKCQMSCKFFSVKVYYGYRFACVILSAAALGAASRRIRPYRNWDVVGAVPYEMARFVKEKYGDKL